MVCRGEARDRRESVELARGGAVWHQRRVLLCATLASTGWNAWRTAYQWDLCLSR